MSDKRVRKLQSGGRTVDAWWSRDHFQKGDQTVLWEYNRVPDNSGYMPERVQKWDGDTLILVKTYKGELAEMSAQRLYNDLVMALVYA